MMKPEFITWWSDLERPSQVALLVPVIAGLFGVLIALINKRPKAVIYFAGFLLLFAASILLWPKCGWGANRDTPPLPLNKLWKIESDGKTISVKVPPGGKISLTPSWNTDKADQRITIEGPSGKVDEVKRSSDANGWASERNNSNCNVVYRFKGEVKENRVANDPWLYGAPGSEGIQTIAGTRYINLGWRHYNAFNETMMRLTSDGFPVE